MQPPLQGAESQLLSRLASCAAASTSGQAQNFSSSYPAAAAAKPAASKSGKAGKRRLDELCVELNPHLSRNVVQSWILQGKVTVDGRPVTKAGTQVSPTSKIMVNAEEPKYVCRAGLKLEAALAHFGVDPTGLVCLDSGQSTGGFSDCLLQHGAAHVYGIDVGYGQVADKVRRDERVTVIERFNLRHLKPADLPTQVDLATLDLAFISVLKVVPAVVGVLRPPPAGQLLVLIKPQFEAGKAQVSHGGVVRDPKVHQEVIARVTGGICALGFTCRGVIESPIKGDKSGNTEFLAHFVRDSEAARDPEALKAALAAAAQAAAADDDEEAEGVAVAEGQGAGPPA